MIKRIFALIIATMMVLTLMMPTALAAGSTVAKIGKNDYTSLQAAVDAAKDGDTIVVTSSHTVDFSSSKIVDKDVAGLIVVSGKTVTIDLNGKKLTGAVDLSGAEIGNRSFAPFVATNNGQLTLKDSVGSGSIDFKKKSDVYALLLSYTGGTITVYGGSYQMDAVTSSLVYAQENENVIIHGGDFYLGNIGLGPGGNGSPWIFNAKGQNTQHALVDGGSFNADILHQFYPFEVDAPKTRALQKNGQKWTMVDAAAYTVENEWSSAWYQHEVGYATLAEAVAAAEPIKTKISYNKEYISAAEYVTLLKNCTVSDTLEINLDLEIKLDGNTIIWAGGSSKPVITVAEGKTLTIGDFTPLRNGHAFLGWYTDASLAEEYAYDLSIGTVPAGTSLYAAWETVEIPETGDGTGLFLFAGLMLVSLLGMVVLKKREQY